MTKQNKAMDIFVTELHEADIVPFQAIRGAPFHQGAKVGRKMMKMIWKHMKNAKHKKGAR